MLILTRALSGGVAAATLEYTDSAANTGGNDWTFPGIDIGDAAPDRVVYVAVTAGTVSGTGTVVDVTIGGVSATQIVKAEGPGSPNAEEVSIWALAVASGTTATIFVDHDDATTGCGIVVWAGYGSSATAEDTATDSGEPTSVSIDIPAGGVCVGMVAVRSNTGGPPSWTWTGLTEDVDGIQWNTTVGDIASGASLASASGETSLTVTADFSGTEVRAAPMAVASFPLA